MGKGGIFLYHAVKSAQRQRKRLLLLEALLAILLAALVALALEETPDAREVQIIWHGQAVSVPASGQTAAQLLHRLGKDPGPEDVLSLPRDTVLQPGMRLYVDRIQHRQEVYTASLTADAVYRRDASLPAGMEMLLDAGTDGELRCTADVEYRNGKAVSRRVVNRELLRAPVPRTIAAGEATARRAEIRGGLIRLPEGTVLTYHSSIPLRASAFPGADSGCLTLADGTMLRIGTASVDPDRISPGTRLFVAAADGSDCYGIAISKPGMQGDRIELTFPTAEECMAFGQRSCTAWVLGSP